MSESQITFYVTINWYNIPFIFIILFHKKLSTDQKGLSVNTHCKGKMPKIWNKYSQKRNIGASVPMSTFMCLWANNIFPRWVCLFCWRKYIDWSWEYINRSKTHECGNWGWGRAIPRKGIYNGIAVAVHAWRSCTTLVNAALGVYKVKINSCTFHKQNTFMDISNKENCLVFAAVRIQYTSHRLWFVGYLLVHSAALCG